MDYQEQLAQIGYLYKHSDLTYSESLYAVLAGKKIQLYSGENCEIISYSDSSRECKAIICGTVAGALGEMLVIDAEGQIDGRDYKSRVYLNGFQIIAVSELSDGINIALIVSGSAFLPNLLKGEEKK